MFGRLLSQVSRAAQVAMLSAARYDRGVAMLGFLAAKADARPTGVYVGWLGPDAWELGCGWKPGDIGYVGIGVDPEGDRWPDHDSKLWGRFIGRWELVCWETVRDDAERIEAAWIRAANDGRGTPFNIALNWPGVTHRLAFEENELRARLDGARRPKRRRGPMRRRGRVHARRRRMSWRERRRVVKWVAVVAAVLWVLGSVDGWLESASDAVRSFDAPSVDVELPDLGGGPDGVDE